VFDQAARLAYAYQVDAPPGSAFVNSKGVVVFKVTGGLSEESVRKIINERLVNRASPPPS